MSSNSAVIGLMEAHSQIESIRGLNREVDLDRDRSLGKAKELGNKELVIDGESKDDGS